MPTYLIHGFRWNRASIRIHIILQNLEDAAAEWIIAPATSITLLNSFYSMFDFLPPSNPPQPTYYPPPPPIPAEDAYFQEQLAKPAKTLSKKHSRSMASLRSLGRRQRRPTTSGNGAPASNNLNVRKTSMNSDSRPRTSAATSTSGHDRHDMKGEHMNGGPKKPAFNDWSVVKLLEQYDPQDMYSVSQPYAYVADHIVEVTLGVSMADEMCKYETKVKAEEGLLSPSIPGTPGSPAMGEDIGSPGISARDLRRKSRRLGWFEKLRDQLQKDGDIGWFVVVCGDEERESPAMEAFGRPSTASDSSSRAPRSAGFRDFFRRRVVYDE